MIIIIIEFIQRYLVNADRQQRGWKSVSVCFCCQKMIIKRVGNLIRSGGEFVYYNNCYNILINVAKAVGKNIRDKIYSNIRNPLDHCKNNNKEHGTNDQLVQ